MVKKGKDKEGGIGLGPSSFVEGTGLISDVDAVFTEVGFVLWDYNGKLPEPNPALRVALNVDGEEVEQYWSAGSAKEFVPSDDGKMLLPVGSQTGLNKNSNVVQLIMSIIEAGFPEDKILEDITVFQGMVAHVVRVPAPKRPGLVKAPRADGRVYEDQVLVVDSIIKLPWEKGKGAAKGKDDTPDEAPAGPLEEKAIETVMGIIAENEKVDKKQLASLTFAALKTDPDRNAIVQLVYKDEFLNSGPWEFDGKVVSGG